MRHSRNGRIDAWQTPSELKAPGTDVREGESSIDGAYGFIRRVRSARNTWTDARKCRARRSKVGAY